MKPRILVIEDETAISDAIAYALETEGFLWHVSDTGAGGLKELDRHAPQLVILDVGLPDMSGFDVFREIRKQSRVPVVFLTARSEEVDRVSGLEMGADDYVTKPFSLRELTARIRAVLRRSGPDATQHPETGSSRTPFEVDEARHQISYRGVPLTLSRYEYGILSLLVRRPGVVFSREELMDLAWDEPGVSDPRTVDTHIKTIRQKLKAVQMEPDPIVTHVGVGYALREDW